MDEGDLGTRLYRVGIPRSRVINIFVLLDVICDHFWYKFRVVKGSDVDHKTYFVGVYNPSPIQGSFIVFPTVTEREDVLSESLCKT